MIFADITHVEFCSALHVWDYLRNVLRIMFGERTGASREGTYGEVLRRVNFREVQIFFTASCVRPIDR